MKRKRWWKNDDGDDDSGMPTNQITNLKTKHKSSISVKSLWIKKTDTEKLYSFCLPSYRAKTKE